jgi:hypothetical protein
MLAIVTETPPVVPKLSYEELAELRNCAKMLRCNSVLMSIAIEDLATRLQQANDPGWSQLALLPPFIKGSENHD